MAQIALNLNELGIFSGCYESIWLHSETNLDEFIGEISEWKEFDQEEIDEKFLIETVTTVTPR